MVTDPFVTAKASLRDNVKTLVAVFGGVAGVLLAGTPFSGYGALELFSTRWWVASAMLLLALVLLGVCVWRLLDILRPDLTYLSLLTQQTSDPEILVLQDEFAKHRSELLPDVRPPQAPIDTVERLIEARAAAWAVYQRDRGNERKQLAHDRLADTLASLNHWSGFTRLHIRVSRGVGRVLLLGLPTLLCIAVFVLAASSQKDKEAASGIVTVIGGGESAPAQPALPRLAPVRFDTNRFELTPEALQRVEAARNALREHPETGLLLFANTDTVGGEKLNRALAVRRAASVVQALREGGGISPSRLFALPLAEGDLPALTAQETPSPANRAVEMILVPLPPRAAASGPR